TALEVDDLPAVVVPWIDGVDAPADAHSRVGSELEWRFHPEGSPLGVGRGEVGLVGVGAGAGTLFGVAADGVVGVGVDVEEGESPERVQFDAPVDVDSPAGGRRRAAWEAVDLAPVVAAGTGGVGDEAGDRGGRGGLGGGGRESLQVEQPLSEFLFGFLHGTF